MSWPEGRNWTSNSLESVLSIQEYVGMSWWRRNKMPRHSEWLNYLKIRSCRVCFIWRGTHCAGRELWVTQQHRNESHQNIKTCVSHCLPDLTQKEFRFPLWSWCNRTFTHLLSWRSSWRALCSKGSLRTIVLLYSYFIQPQLIIYWSAGFKPGSPYNWTRSFSPLWYKLHKIIKETSLLR